MRGKSSTVLRVPDSPAMSVGLSIGESTEQSIENKAKVGGKPLVQTIRNLNRQKKRTERKIHTPRPPQKGGK